VHSRCHEVAQLGFGRSQKAAGGMPAATPLPDATNAADSPASGERAECGPISGTTQAPCSVRRGPRHRSAGMRQKLTARDLGAHVEDGGDRLARMFAERRPIEQLVDLQPLEQQEVEVAPVDENVDLRGHAAYRG
jgi:hypothetical protein